MRAYHLKNILNLFKKNTQTFNIHCISSNELIIHLIDKSTNELVYHFELNSDNNLIESKTYILNVNDLYRLFKYVKSEALVRLTDNSNSISLLIITSLDLSQSIEVPKIIDTQTVLFKLYDIFIINPKVSLKLSDFSRMIKSLKNTSDLYSFSISNNSLIFSNENAVIPISYVINTESDLTQYPSSITTISNNCMLKLNKLQSDNSTIEIGKDFISGFIDNELKYYIQFI